MIQTTDASTNGPLIRQQSCQLHIGTRNYYFGSRRNSTDNKKSATTLVAQFLSFLLVADAGNSHTHSPNAPDVGSTAEYFTARHIRESQIDQVLIVKKS